MKKKTLTKAEIRRGQFEELVRLKQIERLTNQEAADRLRVSRRTVQYWLEDPEYAETVKRLRLEWKENAITQVADLTQAALATMYELMSPNTRSEHVRFEAAKAIGDWAGIQINPEEDQHDDRGELDRLTKLLAERPPVVVNQIFTEPVEGGGFLPKPLQRTVNMDEFLATRAQNQLDSVVVEGTIEEPTI